MRRHSVVTILIISLLITGQAIAGTYEDALEEYGRGEYKAAYQLLKPLAEEGNSNAQMMLGFMYDQGRGVPRDSVETEKWLRRSAKQGNIGAQITLSLMKERAEKEMLHRGAAE